MHPSMHVRTRIHTPTHIKHASRKGVQDYAFARLAYHGARLSDCSALNVGIFVFLEKSTLKCETHIRIALNPPPPKKKNIAYNVVIPKNVYLSYRITELFKYVI